MPANSSGGLDTLSSSLAWMPTTGEFGPGFGDFEGHERLATRVGVHYTRSDENRQSQPDTEAIDNAQIRISDGNVIFAPGLFGEGIAISDAQHHMSSIDAGLKYRGLASKAILLSRSDQPARPWNRGAPVQRSA